HRLDKDTSGALVIARTLTAHAALVRQLQARTVSRIYQALARGEIDAPGRVDAPIGRHPADRKRMAVVRSGRGAVTHYRVLQRYTGFTLLEVSLETGRTHQIRVHLSHLGHPLVGDPVYARRVKRAEVPDHVLESVRAFPRQALHAWRLSFRHPCSGEPVAFEAPVPADLAGLLGRLAEVRRD
ncbi:MAG: RluA family pseudouridine synthase, partial [Xanthomonadales bacterium]|nr:RluA family pseudouridine synthase [Xanthomonadales bacterium]